MQGLDTHSAMQMPSDINPLLLPFFHQTTAASKGDINSLLKDNTGYSAYLYLLQIKGEFLKELYKRIRDEQFSESEDPERKNRPSEVLTRELFDNKKIETTILEDLGFLDSVKKIYTKLGLNWENGDSPSLNQLYRKIGKSLHKSNILGDNNGGNDIGSEFKDQIVGFEKERVGKIVGNNPDFVIVKSGGVLFTTEGKKTTRPSELTPGGNPYDPNSMGTGGAVRVAAAGKIANYLSEQPTYITTGSFATDKERQLAEEHPGIHNYAHTYKNALEGHGISPDNIITADKEYATNTFTEIVCWLNVIYEKIIEQKANNSENIKDIYEVKIISNAYHLERLQRMVEIILYGDEGYTGSEKDRYQSDYIARMKGVRNAMFANVLKKFKVDLHDHLSPEKITFLQQKLNISFIPAEDVVAPSNASAFYLDPTPRNPLYVQMQKNEMKGLQGLNTAEYRKMDEAA